MNLCKLRLSQSIPISFKDKFCSSSREKSVNTQFHCQTTLHLVSLILNFKGLSYKGLLGAFSSSAMLVFASVFFDSIIRLLLALEQFVEVAVLFELIGFEIRLRLDVADFFPTLRKLLMA